MRKTAPKRAVFYLRNIVNLRNLGRLGNLGKRHHILAEKCGSRSCIAKADFRLAKPEKPQFTKRK
mgnify:CR=1 FL=1